MTYRELTQLIMSHLSENPNLTAPLSVCGDDEPQLTVINLETGTFIPHEKAQDLHNAGLSLGSSVWTASIELPTSSMEAMDLWVHQTLAALLPHLPDANAISITGFTQTHGLGIQVLTFAEGLPE